MFKRFSIIKMQYTTFDIDKKIFSGPLGNVNTSEFLCTNSFIASSYVDNFENSNWISPTQNYLNREVSCNNDNFILSDSYCMKYNGPGLNNIFINCKIVFATNFTGKTIDFTINTIQGFNPNESIMQSKNIIEEENNEIIVQFIGDISSPIDICPFLKINSWVFGDSLIINHYRCEMHQI